MSDELNNFLPVIKKCTPNIIRKQVNDFKYFLHYFEVSAENKSFV